MNKESLYNLQLQFQQKLNKLKLNKNLEGPIDDNEQFCYHMIAMVEELGEVLSADKRWKMYRNTKHDQENKKEELSDVLITVLNLFIYSGISEEQMYEMVRNKINENIRRIENAN